MCVLVAQWRHDHVLNDRWDTIIADLVPDWFDRDQEVLGFHGVRAHRQSVEGQEGDFHSY